MGFGKSCIHLVVGQLTGFLFLFLRYPLRPVLLSWLSFNHFRLVQHLALKWGPDRAEKTFPA